ncbi:Pol poly [Paramuricea clavata]|uniref:Pol poly n=1 Tax=Paramuricea clavata TaxID=317549 RepID=A0A7D9E0G0_PARCT|nr:Pol poly [Paramuricea clavata]
MKKQQSEMDAKLKALNFRLKRCDEVLGNEDRAAINRHCESITTIVSTISILKGSIEEAKFAQSESDESIEQWSTEIENQIALADKCMQKLADFVKTIDQRAKEPSIRTAIDCLPFTDEGYTRAFKYLEDKYGHPSEVAGSYVVSLLELPTISERDVSKIHRFYEQLLFNIESLETLGKLDSIEGTTYYVLRKLEIIKAELVTHVKTDWRDWTFKDLLESLKKWTETNLVPKVHKRDKFGKDPYSQSPGGQAFGSRNHEIKCVYCESTDHRAKTCDKVLTPLERKKILAKKRLCFNCASGQHHANSCKSKISCQLCEERHHTSICESKNPDETNNGTSFTASINKTSVIHPVVLR